MKYILIAIFVLMASVCHCQVDSALIPHDVVWELPWKITSTKACTKIQTDEKSVYDLITIRYADSLKYVTIQYKPKKHYIIYLPLGMQEEVISYLKSDINMSVLIKK